MTEPMTPEGRARLMADVDRIRDLVEGQSLGALTVPDGRDMEALARVVRDVPDLAAEADASNRARDHVRKKNLEVDRILTEAIKEHVPPQKRPTLVKAANEAARLIRRQAAELERLRAELDDARQDGKRVATVVEYAGHDREEQRHRADAAEAELTRSRATAHSWRTAYDDLARIAVRLRFAWESARRDRRSARLLNKELVRSMEMLRAEHAEEIADFERTRDEMAAARRQAEEDRDDALREAERLRAERDAARVGVEKLREVLVAADKETTGLREERDRLAEQVRRVRDYAKGGCLGSKSTIYNRVGEDLLTIVGDGTEAGQ